MFCVDMTRFRGWISLLVPPNIWYYITTPTLLHSSNMQDLYRKLGNIRPTTLYKAGLPASPRSQSEISNVEKRKNPSALIGPTRFFYCLFILPYFTYSWGGSSNRNLKLEIVNWLLNHLGNVIQQTGWLGQYIFNKLKKVIRKFSPITRILWAGHVHSVLISFFAKCFPFCFC